jgi:hypothetical protein
VALFLGLYLGHVLGDFVFQPGRLVIAKRRHIQAVALHTAIVTASTAAVLAGSLASAWPAVVLTGIAHFAVEYLTIHARRSPSSSNLTVFLLDQALHVVSIAIIATIFHTAPVSPVLGPWSTTLAWLATACAAATVAFGGSILVFEVEVALEPPASSDDPILSLDGRRLYGFVERGGALLAALLLPSPLFGLAVFAPRLAYAWIGPSTQRRSQIAALAVGLTACVIAWALVNAVGTT